MNAKIDSFEKRLQFLKDTIFEKQRQIAAIQCDIGRMERERNALQKQCIDIGGVFVTDHALVRHLERVQGQDVYAFRQLVCPARTVEQIKTLGGQGIFSVNFGEWRLRVEDFTVYTVLAGKEK